MSNDPDIADRMMALFAGYSKASGTHGMPERDPNGLKWSIKTTAKTIKKGPTLAWWREHDAGTRPLGVVPICDDSTCVWGSIDIDRYDVNLLEVIAKVESLKLPLVPCQSKSGGLHLFLFTAAPVPAEKLQAALRSLAAVVGFPDSEIFPKQTHVDDDTSGNWMVMPYFGGTFDGKLKFQCGLKKTGAEMTVNEFLSFAEKSRITGEQLAAISTPAGDDRPRKKSSRLPPQVSVHKPQPGEPFGDGPPCLQILSKTGFPEGGRNDSLVHLGIYLKKAFPADWRKHLEDDNEKYMRPPLSREEVSSVQRQLEKKDYEYLCKRQPMMSNCDSLTCVAREFGVGDGTGIAVITGMRKVNYNSEDPDWFVTVKGSNKEMKIEDAKDIAIHSRFVTQCVKQLNISFPPVSAAVWSKFVNAAFAIMSEEDASIGSTRAGHFHELLESFLTNRIRGDSRDDLLRGVPWENERERRHEFRLGDLAKFLDREGMRNVKRRDIQDWIKAMGGDELETSIKGKAIRLWRVPSKAITPTPTLDPPPMPEEQI